MTTRSLSRPLRALWPTDTIAAPVGEAQPIEEHRPVAAVAAREWMYRRLLAVADMGATAIALLITLSMLGSDQLRPGVALALPLVIVVAKLQGLYDRDAMLLKKTTLDEAPKLFALATVYTLLMTIGDKQFIRGNLSERQTIGLWMLLFVWMLAMRWLARMLAARVSPVERVLVVGTEDAARRLRTKFSEADAIHATVIAQLPIEATEEEVEAVVLTSDIHRVVIAPTGTAGDGVLEAVRAAKGMGVRVSVLPRILEVIGSSVEFDHLNGVTLMGVRPFGLPRSSALVKRTLDLVGATLGLLALAPAIAAGAALIKLTSPGPVFFRQKRIGRDGRPFQILKFRTMVDGADAMKDDLRSLNEAHGLFKIADDPRVTTIGRFLRHTSLDELPQLFNVLRGEMSLVGPRPLVEEEDRRIEGRHRRRLHLKPGMTGQWQIFGSSRIPLEEMVTIDYLYVANWSLLNDVKILCRTLPYMLSGRGL